MIDYVCVYIYIYVHTLHLLSLCYHDSSSYTNFMSLQPGGTVWPSPRSDSNSSPRWGLKILKPSDMSTSMGWMVLWVESYGLYPQGPRKDQ